jgi:ketosteroid isomerase-like protein
MKYMNPSTSERTSTAPAAYAGSKFRQASNCTCKTDARELPRREPVVAGSIEVVSLTVHPLIVTAMRKTNDVFCSQVVKLQLCDALEEVYTQDARMLPPGGELVIGRTNIIAFWKSTIPSLRIQSAILTTLEAEPAGDSVVEIGRAELTVADGEVVTAKYVIQWKQETGSWKWHIDIWNSN